MNRVLLIGSEGYIGRILSPQLACKYELDCCDIGWYDDPREHKAHPLYRKDYKELKGSLTIQKYDAVILLGAHSSVPMCRDLRSSFNNNVSNFVDLLEKLAPEQPLIYASSGSVYGNGGGQFRETDPLNPPMNWYDQQKQTIDEIALMSGKKVYGLRFGTVNGASPCMRTELMLNSMYLSAKNTKSVRFNNKDKSRAILGNKDLVAGIKAILEYVGAKGPKNTGVYNLASFNSSIGYMANKVCEFMDVIPQEVPDGPTYSFQLNTQKFQEVFDWVPSQNIEDILLDLKKNCGKITEAQREPLSRNRMIKYE